MMGSKGPGWTAIGFRDIGLDPGEELKLIKGDIFQTRQPEKITVIEENDRFVQLELTFVKSMWPTPDRTPRKTRICVGKGAMLCGDIILARVGDSIPLTGKRVAKKYVYLG